MLVFVIFAAGLASHAADKDIQALIHRVNPAHAGRIQIVDCAAADGLEHFRISEKNGQLQLAGSSDLAKASAYGWYLRHVANGHLSWGGAQLGNDLETT